MGVVRGAMIISKETILFQIPEDSALQSLLSAICWWSFWQICRVREMLKWSFFVYALVKERIHIYFPPVIFSFKRIHKIS